MTKQEKNRMYGRAERIQDVCLVSSFCLWAMVIGFSPVLAFHMLMAS
jgi:hypothetical protein